MPPAAPATGLPPVLSVIAMASFAAALSMRALDPVLPHLADELLVSIATAAGLSSALAFTFAIVQPVLGAAADLFGKAKLMVVCLVLLGLSNILGAMTSSYELLLATRVLAGIGAGGVFPVTLSLASDLVAPGKRQIALSRVMAGSMAGNVLGATASGVIGDVFGWRGVLAALGGLAILSSAAIAIGFKNAKLAKPVGKVDLGVLRHGYRTIFRNPNSFISYTAVFIEGCCVLGMFPFLASFLLERGVTSLSIAGIVLACFAVGGLFYAGTISRMLPRIGINGMMISGGMLIGLQLAVVAFNPPWQLQGLSLLFMGWGFLHAARLAADLFQRAFAGGPRQRHVAACVLLLHGAERRPGGLRVRNFASRKNADVADRWRDHLCAGICLREAAAAKQAG